MIISKYDNLILLKSFYYANSNVSYIIASKEIISTLKELGNCSRVSDYDMTLCELIFDDKDYYKSKAEKLEKERDSYKEKLKENSHVSEVKSLYKNYILFKCLDQDLVDELKEKGLRLRTFGKNKRLKNYMVLEVHNDEFY